MKFAAGERFAHPLEWFIGIRRCIPFAQAGASGVKYTIKILD